MQNWKLVMKQQNNQGETCIEMEINAASCPIGLPKLT